MKKKAVEKTVVKTETKFRSFIFYAFEAEDRIGKEIERKAKILANKKEWEVTAMNTVRFDILFHKVGVLVALKVKIS